jgi:hypothetical protein
LFRINKIKDYVLIKLGKNMYKIFYKIVLVSLFLVRNVYSAEFALDMPDFYGDYAETFITHVPEEDVMDFFDNASVLTEESVNALSALIQKRRWTDSEGQFSQAAKRLGVKESTLRNAIRWAKRKEINKSLTREEIQKYSDQLLKKNRLEVNSHILRNIGFTPESLNGLAQELGVSHKLLEEHRKFLLHECKLHASYNLDDVRAACQLLKLFEYTEPLAIIEL